MVDYKEKYKGIVDELIEKNFPELGGKRILVSETSTWVGKGYSAVAYYLIWFTFIKISLKLRKYSDLEVKGVLAHELGHVLRFESCGFFGKLWKGFRYFTSRGARTVEENACDKIAVERGYARGLYKFKSLRRKDKRYYDCYLSADDVKKYAKGVGKW